LIANRLGPKNTQKPYKRYYVKSGGGSDSGSPSCVLRKK